MAASNDPPGSLNTHPSHVLRVTATLNEQQQQGFHTWLDTLSEDERATFLAQLEGTGKERAEGHASFAGVMGATGMGTGATGAGTGQDGSRVTGTGTVTGSTTREKRASSIGAYEELDSRRFEDKQTREAIAALARQSQVKSRVTRGKKARIGEEMSAEDIAAFETIHSLFGAFPVPPAILDRFHAKDQQIPLFFLTNDALRAAENPNSPVSKLLAKTDQLLDPKLDFVLSTEDRTRGFSRFVKLWTMLENGDEATQTRVDKAAAAWFKHDARVIEMLDMAADDEDKRIAIGYDINVRTAAHTTTGIFDPGLLWAACLDSARLTVGKDKTDPSRSPSLYRAQHDLAAELLPAIYTKAVAIVAQTAPSLSTPLHGGGNSGPGPLSYTRPVRTEADSYGNSPGSTGGDNGSLGGQGFRSPGGQSSRTSSFRGSETGGALVSRNSPTGCFACGLGGHPASKCPQPGPANAKLSADGALVLDGGNGIRVCAAWNMSGCGFGDGGGGCRKGAHCCSICGGEHGAAGHDGVGRDRAQG
ncbi:hypothetical protein JCM10450v2_003787 [Rhodotorula kratochvilovae]